MAITKTQAKKLLNASELAFFEATTATAIKSLSPAQLAIKIRRARTLRDKARDQFQRQRLATRDRTGTKRGNTGIANARTQEKAAVFDEILARLQTQADKVEARAAKADARAAKAAAKPAAKKATSAASKKMPSRRRKASNKADRAAAKSETRSAKRSAVAKRKATKSAAAKSTGAKAAVKTPAAKKAAAKKEAPKKAAAKKAAAKTTAAKKTVAKKSVAKKSATAAKKAPAKKAAAPKKARKPAGLFGVPGLSPKAPAPLQRPSDETTATARTGYVSKRAKATAKQRGFEESRTKVIQSHVSASARRNQAKRDKR